MPNTTIEWFSTKISKINPISSRIKLNDRFRKISELRVYISDNNILKDLEFFDRLKSLFRQSKSFKFYISLKKIPS